MLENKDDVQRIKDAAASQVLKFFDAVNDITVSGSIEARAQADLTEGFTTAAPSSGEHNSSVHDELRLIEIRHGSTNSEVAIAARTMYASNHYGISADTFGGNALTKAIEARNDAMQYLDAIAGQQKDNAMAAVDSIKNTYDDLYNELDKVKTEMANNANPSIEDIIKYETQLDNIARQTSLTTAGHLNAFQGQFAENAASEIAAGNKVLGGGLLKAANGMQGLSTALSLHGNGQISQAELNEMANAAVEQVGAGMGEMAGAAIFGENPGLMGQIGTKVLSLVGKWLLGNRSLVELAIEAIKDWWDNLNVIETVASSLGKLSGLPMDVTNKIVKYAKKVWERGLDPKIIFEAFDSMTVNGAKVNSPELKANFDTSNIGAMIRSVFSAGVAPFKFVDKLLAPIQKILENKILNAALLLWMIIKPNSGAYTAIKLVISIRRTVVWARAKLNSIISAINGAGELIVKYVDDLIKDALTWLLNLANVGIGKLKPLLSMLPFDSSIILKSILSMFSLNNVVEITTKASGITKADQAECGIGNEKVNNDLEAKGEEASSLTQQDTPGSKQSAPEPKKLTARVILAKGGDGKVRQINLQSLPPYMQNQIVSPQ